MSRRCNCEAYRNERTWARHFQRRCRRLEHELAVMTEERDRLLAKLEGGDTSVDEARAYLIQHGIDPDGLSS